MSSNKPVTAKPKRQMLIKSTLYKTKKFLNKSITNLKSFIPNKQPKTPISPGSNTINSKSQELDDFYTSFSEKCDPNPVEVVVKTEDSFSETVEKKEGCLQCNSGLKTSAAMQSSFIAADVLAQKMKDLEMMDLSDIDHAVDVEEVLHYYSRLTCPLYVDIVDQFFMDMYSDFHVPRPSRSLHCSMRKLSSDSMRSLGPLKL